MSNKHTTGTIIVQKANNPYAEAETKHRRGTKRPGFYMVSVDETGEIYAGSSSMVDERTGQHARDLRNGKHRYTEIQSA